jgi:murein DD-endopeptidase MepM/ murein hydrolase activator NlpD
MVAMAWSIVGFVDMEANQRRRKNFSVILQRLAPATSNNTQLRMRAAELKILAKKRIAHAVNHAWHTEGPRLAISVGVLLTLPVFGILTAFGVASDSQLDKIPRQSVEQVLNIALTEQADSVPSRFQASDRVQRGDTVAAILQRLQVDDRAAFDFLRTSPKARSLFTKLRPGRTIQAITSDAGELQSLRYYLSAETYLDVQRTASGFEASEKSLTSSAVRQYKSGTIRSSLFAATDEAGIPDAVAMQLVRIFSTDIDFHVDLRRGDRFSVVYEQLHHDGEPMGAGRVLSAEFTNAGKTFQAYLFTDDQGADGYYSADGQNRAKSFLRSPLAFSRVSSGFGGRMHPIFKNWRQHTGVDFAAPRGTPVWATADGTVEFAGVRGGYGNAIEVRHNSGITTLYGHLQGFAASVRKGTRVSQGQTIGFVGATGYATGPHLHYEFKLAGIHQDPMRVALPKAEPLDPKYLSSFKSAAQLQGQQLALLRDAQFGRFE